MIPQSAVQRRRLRQKQCWPALACRSTGCQYARQSETDVDERPLLATLSLSSSARRSPHRHLHRLSARVWRPEDVPSIVGSPTEAYGFRRIAGLDCSRCLRRRRIRTLWGALEHSRPSTVSYGHTAKDVSLRVSNNMQYHLPSLCALDIWYTTKAAVIVPSSVDPQWHSFVSIPQASGLEKGQLVHILPRTKKPSFDRRSEEVKSTLIRSI